MYEVSSIREYLDRLRTMGRYTFTREEAERDLGKSSTAVTSALRRLKENERIASPRKGFFIIVLPEYRRIGSLPPSWFVDDLMKYLDQPYYVGLLSAAELHGSAHHRPQVFQVMTDRPTRPAQAGKVRIDFHTNRFIEDTPTEQVTTRAGYMTISTPDATAVDLVRYYKSSGGLDHVATVLSELAERIDPVALAAAASLVEEPVAQRLGYLLDLVGQEELTVPLHRLVSVRRSRPTPLMAGMNQKSTEADQRWNVIPNVEIESDV